MAMSQSERDELSFRLGQIFRPTMPINREDLFAGRQNEVRDVVDAINQAGQHVVLFGERGVGKTSLANIIMYRLHSPGGLVMTPHINCSSANSYDAIWTAVLDDIEFRAERKDIALPRWVQKLASDFDNGSRVDFPPELARRLVVELAETMEVVVIIDEFDQLENVETRQRIADAIKYFSDRNVPATIMLIGVAEDIDGLIADHRSVSRCIAQVRMPRMSRDEVESIVVNCLNQVKLKIEAGALHEISRIAKGLPHYAHLLGLHAGRRAVAGRSKTIKQADIQPAIKTAIQKVQVSIRTAYQKATISTKKNALYKQVILACSMAEADEYGYFSPSDVREPLERILKRQYGIEAFARHLHAFCEEERGPALKRADFSNRPRFRFTDPLLQPFALMKGLDEGIVSEDDLKATRDLSDPQGRLF